MKYLPAGLFAFIVLSMLGFPFPKWISKYLWWILNAVTLYVLWPKVKELL